MPYDVGDTVRVKATITDKDSGTLVDPTTVVFTVYRPSGATQDPDTVQETATGKWTVTFVPDVGGDWHVGAATTNPRAAAQRKVRVNPVPL
jgi:uncharacterized protein YfaS (alpha-2-macroglobulin family)